MIFVIYGLALAISNLPGRPLAPLALQRWRFFTRGLGLSESWGMFGAAPSKDGWYIAGAKLKDGSVVDLLRHGAPLDTKRPDFPARLYPNYFWQKLFREMSYDDEQGFQLLRRPVAEYLCRNWNVHNSPEKQVAEFELIFCMQDKAEAKKTPAAQIFAEKLVRLRAGEF